MIYIIIIFLVLIGALLFMGIINLYLIMNLYNEYKTLKIRSEEKFASQYKHFLKMEKDLKKQKAIIAELCDYVYENTK